jgi:EAL domain-containing protein (putative c-di-GMP-specific phosphodiesterase class I)/GGDEF domain-containing protein
MLEDSTECFMSSPVIPLVREKLSEPSTDFSPHDVLHDTSYDSVLALTAKLFGVCATVIHILEGTQHWFEHGTGTTSLGKAFLDASLDVQSARLGAGAEQVVIHVTAADWLFPVNSFPQADRHIRFCAHTPLTGMDGTLLGSLWLLDSRANPDFRNQEKSLLIDLATVIVEKNETARAFQYQDRLTGLPNRTRFVKDVRAQWKLANSSNRPVYAVIVDACSLPYIERMVAALGLSIVEHAILSMTERVQGVMPRELDLYRIGYARFCVLCIGDIEVARALAARCVACFEQPITVADALPITLSAYAGLMLIDDEASASDVVGALFAVSARARKAGDTLLEYDKNLTLAQQRCFHIINSARGALASSDQFRLLFQPRERLIDGACVAAEALIRWNHPSLGEISPAEFIPMIETTSLMPQVTDWVIDQALQQLAPWTKTAPSFKLSINISASDLSRVDFVFMLKAGMKRHGVSGKNIEIEVTESALAQDVVAACNMLERLAELEVSVAIDDFGAGYSNLSQLYALPFNVLKIDQALIREVLTNERAEAIVQCVVALAKRLGHRVVVEGVETAELRSAAARWKCDEAQGYFISRPMEALRMHSWIAEHCCR